MFYSLLPIFIPHASPLALACSALPLHNEHTSHKERYTPPHKRSQLFIVKTFFFFANSFTGNLTFEDKIRKNIQQHNCTAHDSISTHIIISQLRKKIFFQLGSFLFLTVQFQPIQDTSPKSHEDSFLAYLENQ